MENKDYELINKMVVKIDEARTYHRISGVITIGWLIEFFHTFFWTKNFNYMYWLIWLVSMVGFIHMNRKYRFAMKEYEELKKEYETRFEDENI